MNPLRPLLFTLLMFVSDCAISQVNLNNGLIAYYPFNGNANDMSGNGHHPIFNNAVPAPDRFGNANGGYYFNGSNSYMRIPNHPSLSPSMISMVAIVKPMGFFQPTCHGNVIINKGDDDLDIQSKYRMRFDDGPFKSFTQCNTPVDEMHQNFYADFAGNGAISTSYNPFIVKDQWYCVVFTFDGSTARLYVNGSLINSRTGNTPYVANSADLFFGRLNSPAFPYWLNGVIDEIRLYNRPLNNQEVAALCNTPTALCTGSLGDPVVNITFGAGNNPAAPLPAIVPGASTSLSYVPVMGNPATPTPFDGQYTITNNTPLNNAWYSGFADHTPNDINGYMAFYNSQETAGLEFYQQAVNNLCGSTTYEFAAWIANCLNPAFMNGVDPDITFRIERPDGTLIASYNTGPIAESPVFRWQQYGFFFTMPANETSVVLKMINNSVGGTALPGNDLAIDDITFRPCGPASNASFNSSAQLDSLTVCEGSAVTMFGSLSTGFTTPNYRWQVSTNNGQTWNDIASSNSLTFSLTTAIEGVTRVVKYRMVAGDGTNINSASCRVSSNVIVLKILPQILCNQTTVGTPISGIINNYAEVLGFDACKNGIIVNDASSFHIGDTVIIAQMKGAVIDETNSSSFGAITNYGNAGNYEFNYISEKTGNTLILRNELLRTYSIPDGIVQLVRVPYYSSATVTNTLTSQPWNGRTGGILALNVRDTLIVASTIDVSGKGFMGGRAVNSRALVTNCTQNGFTYPSGSNLAAPKGESIAVIGPSVSNGKGAPASAGGGGVDHNSGGGGGANGGIGGFGGYQLEFCTGAAFDNRGIGGKALTYSNAANKIFLGGGGGAGHCNQPLGVNMDGGNGGGIVLIHANILFADNNTILANGANAVQCNLPNIDDCHDGSGGGGGGGTILLDVTNYLPGLAVSTSGGKGGDVIIYNTVGGGRIGPGGGGGGGVVWIKAPSLPANASIISNGGQSGVITMDGNNPWGASAGQSGVQLFDLMMPVSSIPFLENIDTVQVSHSVTSCKNVRFDGNVVVRRSSIANWQWNFGDGTIVNTQTPTVTHGYLWGGAYTAKLVVTDINGCKDSAIVSVLVDTVSAVAVAPPIVCPGETAALSGSGGTIYSWSPAQFLNDASSPNPTATVSTTTQFLLTVSNSVGCEDTASVTVTVRPKTVFNAPLAPPPVCEKTTVQLNGNNSPSYMYSWSPATYLSDPASPNPLASPDGNIEYALRVIDPACNFDSTFTVQLTVRSNPFVTAEKLNDIDCSTPTAPLIAQGALNYSWTPSSGLNNPAIQNPVAAVTTTTTFVVTGSDQFGCSAKDTVIVNVTNGGRPVFELPNAFTPNGDGKNDCFGIRKWGNVTIHEFAVYNRWGQSVFSTKNPSACWDGTVNGKQQDTGGYTYVIKASSICGDIKKTGIVMLIR